jgi:hypothetical protein
MLFRVNWQIDKDNRNEVVTRFLQMADNPDYDLPEGLTLIGRWHNSAGINGTQIFETDDIMLLYNWMSNWTDVLVFECDAVVEDEDAGKLCVEMMRRISQ